jgi:hypothetical protein
MSTDQHTTDQFETADGTPLPPARSGRTAPRPAPASGGVGRVLRAVAGVREEVLDWAPEERPRYSRLGAIIINTGLLAGVSLVVALHHVVDAPSLVLLPIGVFWAFLVISFDSWLIASTHGALGGSKAAVFIPRLFISLLLGAVIAEPLVLWIFQPAIQADVRTHRSQELVAYESQLRVCNPTTGIAVTDPACAKLVLSVSESPAAMRAKLADLQAQRDKLQRLVDDINTEWNRLNQIARNECNGKTGEGLSGRVGQGPNCIRNRADADKYLAQSHLAERQTELTGLDRQITGLASDIEKSSAAYGTQVDEAIKRKVEERRADQGTFIGLLDEVAALGRLSDKSWFVFGAEWLLRALLIALDCMPVLTKLMGGNTRYDRFINAQLEMASRMHTESIGLQERAFRQEARADIERHDQEDRAERSRRQAAERSEIDRLVRQIKEDRRRNAAGPGTQFRQRQGDG